MSHTTWTGDLAARNGLSQQCSSTTPPSLFPAAYTPHSSNTRADNVLPATTYNHWSTQVQYTRNNNISPVHMLITPTHSCSTPVPYTLPDWGNLGKSVFGSQTHTQLDSQCIQCISTGHCYLKFSGNLAKKLKKKKKSWFLTCIAVLKYAKYKLYLRQCNRLNRGNECFQRISTVCRTTQVTQPKQSLGNIFIKEYQHRRVTQNRFY